MDGSHADAPTQGRVYVVGGGALYRGRTYDISPDGKRFLMIKELAGSDQRTEPLLMVEQHFDEELQRLVPTK